MTLIFFSNTPFKTFNYKVQHNLFLINFFYFLLLFNSWNYFSKINSKLAPSFNLTHFFLTLKNKPIVQQFKQSLLRRLYTKKLLTRENNVESILMIIFQGDSYFSQSDQLYKIVLGFFSPFLQYLLSIFHFQLDQSIDSY